MPPPFGSSALTGGLTPFLSRFLMFFGFAAFDVAVILTIPPLAAISARYRAAETVWVLYLLTIFSFLCALQLEHARTSPITVRRVAGSTRIVRRTTVEKIGAPFTFGGGGLRQVPQLPTTALPRVRVGLRRPPSRSLLSRGLPSQMFAQILVHVGVILSLHGQPHHQIDPVMVRVWASFPLGRRSAVIPRLGRNLPR